jgi:anthranilate synthase component 1
MLPVTRELLADTLTPVTAFVRLRAGGGPAFLLESVEGGERIGRYSFLGARPFRRVSARGLETEIADGAGRTLRVEKRSFFEVLDEEMRPFLAAPAPGLPPFTGGAVGAIGYDAVRLIERIPDRHPREDGLPDALFHFHDTVAAFDHARHRILLIANVLLDGRWNRSPAGAEREFDLAQERLDALEAALLRPVDGEVLPARVPELAPAAIDEGMRSNFTRAGFEAAVRRAKEHIAAGDAFQIVLSQRFEKDVSVDPFSVYRLLRALNPSPYLFFLQLDGAAVFGSSPEILVKVQGRTVSVRPIAGTRRRGATEEEDRALEAELLADEKELAEHRMLVDLGRNDVGRVARFGTVRVSSYLAIERYSHVMHIVSQVDGELRDGLGALDAFQAGFPAGTVSGAPKIRAMEIIDDLEPSRRGIYAGAAGYLDFAGNLDTCIAIRTLVFEGGKARVQAGAGIVADSVPEREYFETIHKSSALFEAIRLAEAMQPRHGFGSAGAP